MELKRTYIRTDKNGTKHYDVTYQCDWCNGTGIRPQYMHVYGGVCFYCEGSGFHTREVKEYTEEYAAKLEAKRKAKQEAREAKEQAIRDAWNPLDAVKKEGFGEVIGIVVDAKTGKPVERYEKGSRWLYFTAKCKNIWDLYLTNLDNPVIAEDKNFQVVPMPWDEVFVPNYPTMTLQWNENILQTFLDNHYYGYPKCPKSEAVGKVGERATIKARIVEVKGYDTFYGMKYVYTFIDKDFNKMTWDTAKDLELAEGTEVSIVATVKEHHDWGNEGFVTSLTRCKVAVA